ncbi:methionyl-tRNA formyltransferase [Marivirga sp. S37H4]|uniref:Methionyl-tRNA formyltransferase n=1 Tax=Marivirga aurantiaca TaxID=2802615 RepID=A0A934WW40_9BACT|nr:methionyl-tRNA formyltransferase [Marivirga aurantiaca]MBK6264143.1 methionyl-tRNA formyltransferase [Marivirga aurantiaca]
MNRLRIIYMGTPEFAVPSLKILIENGYNVAAVVTAPDKPKGRGQKLSVSPVKEYALEADVPILQPTNLKDPQFHETLKSYNANLQIVVAFRMLPEIVWDMPDLGTFNLHASLLPQYRGAAPIHRAVMNGEKETGVTTFFLQHEIDTGNIILQEREPIHKEDTTGSVYERLMNKGAELVLKTVRIIEKGEYNLLPQDESQALKHAPKLFKENTEIDWSRSAEDLFNFIRGLNPFPTAWTEFLGKKYKIHASKVTDTEKTGKIGEIITDNKTYLNIQCGKGILSLTEIQQEGKKRMKVADFFRGNQLK